MKKQKKTIGEMTNTRGTWELNPVTRVVQNKKAYTRKKKHNKGWE
jgi:hypothetical protein